MQRCTVTKMIQEIDTNLTTMLSEKILVTTALNATKWADFDIVHMVTVSIVLGAFTIATVIGNIMVLFAVRSSQKRRKNPYNYLLGSLALADLLVGAIVMPLATTVDVTGEWVLGDVLCNLFITVDVLCCTASILNLVAIALDRLLAVTIKTYTKTRTSVHAFIMTGLAWLVSLIVPIVPLIVTEKGHLKPSETGVCLIDQDLIYTVFSTLAAFYIPCVVLIGIYLKIILVTRRQLQWRQRHKIRQRGKEIESDQTTTVKHILMAGLLNATTPSLIGIHLAEPQSLLPSHETSETVKRTGSDTSIPMCSYKRVQFLPTTPPPLALKRRSFSHDDFLLSMKSAPNCDVYGAADGQECQVPQTEKPPRRRFGQNFRFIDDETDFTDDDEKESEAKDRLSKLQPSQVWGKARAPNIGQRSYSQEVPTGYVRSRLLTSPDVLRSSVEHTRDRLRGRNSSSALSKDSPSLYLNFRSLREKKVKINVEKRKTEIKFKLEDVKRRLSEQRTAVTITFLTLAFLATWLPFFIMALWLPFCGDYCRSNYTVNIVLRVFTWTGYLNSTLDPVIYSIYNVSFRRQIGRFTSLITRKN